MSKTINHEIPKVLSVNPVPHKVSVSAKSSSTKPKTNIKKPPRNLPSPTRPVASVSLSMIVASFSSPIEWKKIPWSTISKSNPWNSLRKPQRIGNWKTKWKVFCTASRKCIKIWNCLLKTCFTVFKRWKMSFRLTYCKYPANFWN